MTSEASLIDALRTLATTPASRDLQDDAAVIAPPLGRDMVLTKDMMVEGVHYLPDDPAGDVAWKLLAVNLSDLAAKGATPMGVLLGYCLNENSAWDEAFIAGMARALTHFNVPLWGGDTVRLPQKLVGHTPRVLSLTAIGQAPPHAIPDRRGAKAGQIMWVSGTIGDAAAGLHLAQGPMADADALDDSITRPLLKRFRLPMPRVSLGQQLAPHVTAMMDVSDGLLIDAARMAKASGCGVGIALDAVPLSPFLVAYAAHHAQDDKASRLTAVCGGDDYELLFCADENATPLIEAAARSSRVSVTQIGKMTEGTSLSLWYNNEIIPTPDRLGYVH